MAFGEQLCQVPRPQSRGQADPLCCAARVPGGLLSSSQSPAHWRVAEVLTATGAALPFLPHTHLLPPLHPPMQEMLQDDERFGLNQQELVQLTQVPDGTGAFSAA